MISNHLNIKAFDKTPEETVRSQRVIMIKNLAFDSKKEKLESLFKNYGNIDMMLMPSNKALAIVAFKTIEDAKNAFGVL